jgi:hypothetical protein
LADPLLNLLSRLDCPWRSEKRGLRLLHCDDLLGAATGVHEIADRAREQTCKAWAKAHKESGLHKWLKCKEDFKDEMYRCMTSVEAVDLASTVLALRRIGDDR